ncbi:MAG: RNA methyltransferase [Bacillota bacterium]
MKKRLYIALMHTPVYNKSREVITTSITNLDVHDISRVARTYGVKRYFLVHPQETQRNLVETMMNYWLQGFGSEYNPDRKEALRLLELVSDIDEAQRRIIGLEGRKAHTVVTDARIHSRSVGYQEMRQRISRGDEPYLVLFGTGWGLVKDEIEKADFILHPIEADSDYNHLSVRSAVAIILDRLMGDCR